MLKPSSRYPNIRSERGVFLALAALMFALVAGSLMMLGYRTYIARRSNLVLKTFADVICADLVSDKGAEERDASYLVHPTLPITTAVRFVNSIKREIEQEYYTRSSLEVFEAHLIVPTFSGGNKGTFEFGVTANFPYPNAVGVKFECPPGIRCYMHTDPNYLAAAGSEYPTRVRNFAAETAPGPVSPLAGTSVFCEVRARSLAPFGPTQDFKARAGWTNPVRSHVPKGAAGDTFTNTNFKLGLTIAVDPTLSSAYMGYDINWNFNGGDLLDGSVADGDVDLTPHLSNPVEILARACETNTLATCPLACFPLTAGECDGTLDAAETLARDARIANYITSVKPGLEAGEWATRHSMIRDANHFALQVNGDGFTWTQPWRHFWFQGTANDQQDLMDATPTWNNAYAVDERYWGPPGNPTVATIPFANNFRNLEPEWSIPIDWTWNQQGGVQRSYYIEPTWKQTLITACMNPYILMRNSYLATIIAQAMRHGAMRYQTEVLVMQPTPVIACPGDPNGCLAQNPPSVLIPFGEDLNSRSPNFRLPLVDFGLNAYNDLNNSDFFTVGDLKGRHWYYSLIAQQLRLCYHLYNADGGSGAGIQTFNIDRPTILNSSGDKITKNVFGAGGGYLAERHPAGATAGTRTSDWGASTALSLTDGNPNAAPGGSLTAIEAVSMLGSIQRCPVQISSDNVRVSGSSDPMAVTYSERWVNPGMPSSCAKPLLGGTNKNIGSGTASNGTATTPARDLRGDIVQTLTYIRDQGGDSHILLVLNRGIPSGLINTVKNLVNQIQCGSASLSKNHCKASGWVDNDDGFRTHRPITIVYMPFRSADSDGTAGLELDNMMQAFFIDAQAGATGNTIYMMSPFIERYKGMGLVYSPDNTTNTRLDKWNTYWGMTYGARWPIVRSAFTQFQRRILTRTPLF